MKRPLLVLAAGLIGLLLGVGLSLVADAVAGSDLSEPVPLGIATEAARIAPSRSPQHDGPGATETPSRPDDHDGAKAGGEEPSGSLAPSSPEPTETRSSSEDGSDTHEDDSGGSSEESGGDDD